MSAREPSLADLGSGISVRHPGEPDYLGLQEALGDWWGSLGGEAGALQRRLLVPRLYLQHFTQTSFLAEDSVGALQAFLVGFMSQTRADTAYIHFVGVRPEARRLGLGSALYRLFFDAARSNGRIQVRCITSPANRESVAYHLRMGFRIEPGDRDVDGVPIQADYDGPGLDRVSFVCDL
jgi:ribosomal protein S18 acetylase RimI-like enzyme